MTDKEQIIIDGVDVSECGNWCQLKQCEGYKCVKWHLLKVSQENKKTKDIEEQLARKTQELETICKSFDIEYGYDEETGAIVGRCNKLIEKEKELEGYKQSLDEKNKFLQDLGISAGGEFKRIKFYIDRYRKALEDIKELISDDAFIRCPIYDDEHCNYGTSRKILDIINKAKEEE